MKITIEVPELLFTFKDFDDWVDNAAKYFIDARRSSLSTVCVDTAGRICFVVRHFSRAQKEKTFPIKCYALSKEKY